MQHPNLPSLRKMRWLLFLLGLFKIPMIGFVRPRLLAIDDEHVVLRIRLSQRTKNHLGSMYFGALAVGADLAGAIHSMYFTGGKGMSMSFKSLHAEFLKRAEGTVYFESNDGKIIRSMIEESRQNGERVNRMFNVKAKNENGEEVAIFRMEISIKMKST
jgi:acyl-coenzyme A thioesterase PaaI-like protein